MGDTNGTNGTYNRMRTELEELKQKMDWLDSSFLLESEVDRRKAYGFLRENPKAAKFLYKKYENLRPVLKELTDPDNPLYLREIANELKDLIRNREVEKTLEELKKEQFDLQQNVIDLKKTLQDTTKEYDSFESKISNGKKELDDIEKQIANLREEESLKRIKSFSCCHIEESVYIFPS